MLVLSRKLGQKVFIGEDVCVTVVDIGHGKIRLGIDAPRGVSVDRAEVRAAKDAERGHELGENGAG